MTMEEETPHNMDTRSVIQKSIELGKEQQIRKAHPLGGHLVDMFRDVSSKLIDDNEPKELPHKEEQKVNAKSAINQKELDKDLDLSSLASALNTSQPLPQEKEEQPKPTVDKNEVVQKTLKLAKKIQ